MLGRVRRRDDPRPAARHAPDRPVRPRATCCASRGPSSIVGLLLFGFAPTLRARRGRHRALGLRRRAGRARRHRGGVRRPDARRRPGRGRLVVRLGGLDRRAAAARASPPRRRAPGTRSSLIAVAMVASVAARRPRSRPSPAVDRRPPPSVMTTTSRVAHARRRRPRPVRRDRGPARRPRDRSHPSTRRRRPRARAADHETDDIMSTGGPMTTPAGHDDELTTPGAPGRVSRPSSGRRSPCSSSSSSTGSTSRRWAARLPAIRDGLDFSPGADGRCCCSSAPSARSSRCRCRAWSSSGSAPAARCSRSRPERDAAWSSRRSGSRSAQVLVVGFGLVLFGVGTGVWDASMNVEGAAVEQHLGRTIMPRYHAGFSFGTVAAAGDRRRRGRPARARRRARPGRRRRCSVVGVGVRGAARSCPARRRARGRARARTRAGEGRAAARWPPGWSRARCSSASSCSPRPSPRGPPTTGSASRSSTASTCRRRSGALAFAVFVTAMTAMRWFGTTLLDRYGRVAVLRLCAGAVARRPAGLRAWPGRCGSPSSASSRGARVPRSGSRSA